jgi:hypothetical protein
MIFWSEPSTLSETTPAEVPPNTRYVSAKALPISPR